jgi:hypothetical protein
MRFVKAGMNTKFKSKLESILRKRKSLFESVTLHLRIFFFFPFHLSITIPFLQHFCVVLIPFGTSPVANCSLFILFIIVCLNSYWLVFLDCLVHPLHNAWRYVSFKITSYHLAINSRYYCNNTLIRFVTFLYIPSMFVLHFIHTYHYISYTSYTFTFHVVFMLLFQLQQIEYDEVIILQPALYIFKKKTNK